MIDWAFSFEVGLQFVVVRATLLRANPAHPGGMAAIAAFEGKVARYISKLDIDSHITITIYNDPESHVVSGEMKALAIFSMERRLHRLIRLLLFDLKTEHQETRQETPIPRRTVHMIDASKGGCKCRSPAAPASLSCATCNARSFNSYLS